MYTTALIFIKGGGRDTTRYDVLIPPADTDGITNFLSSLFIFLLCGGPESAGMGEPHLASQKCGLDVIHFSF
jgi:hypothetical protein